LSRCYEPSIKFRSERIITFTPNLQSIVYQIGGRNEKYCSQATRIIRLERRITFTPNLQSIVYQIGGRNEKYYSQATRIIEKYGYQEVILNPRLHHPGRLIVRIVSAIKSNLVTEIPIFFSKIESGLMNSTP